MTASSAWEGPKVQQLRGTERCPGLAQRGLVATGVEMQGPGASRAEPFTMPGSFMKLLLSRIYVHSLSITKYVSVSKGKPL